MIERQEYLDFLIKLKDKNIIKIVTGVRRCGKSTLFTLFKEYLLKNQVSKDQIISLNFEDVKDNTFKNWEELYNYIDSKLLEGKMNYIFLDEIQTINGFEKAVAGLLFQKNVDLYIFSSNACVLSEKFSTYLAGKYMHLHMLPLSFKEYINYYGNDNVDKKYSLYVQNGGFPYLLNSNNDTNTIRNLLDCIYSTILLKDLLVKNNIVTLEKIIKFIFSNIGQLVSTNKIVNSIGFGSISTVNKYLSNLLDCYIIYKISRYDIKKKIYLKTGVKYYVCDLGLRKYLLGVVRDYGSILENIIFLELKRRNYEIYIGKYDDMEVDFVIKNKDGIKYIQVSSSVIEEKTLKHELKSLQAIPDNYPKYIITLDYEYVYYDGIKQINAIDFLLGNVEI